MATHDHDDDQHHGSELSEAQLRVRALETVLTEKGYIDPVALDALIEAYETKVGPHRGARVVAKAWADPEFKRALLADGTAAIRDAGLFERVSETSSRSPTRPRHTTWWCARCAPATRGRLLGLPPVWYKSAPYRSRAVSDPRGVLREFGVQLAEDVDHPGLGSTTSDVRYLVARLSTRRNRGHGRGRARHHRDPRLHDRGRDAARSRTSRDEWRPRHGRHARLRQSQRGAERAGVPRRLGGAHLCDQHWSCARSGSGT